MGLQQEYVTKGVSSMPIINEVNTTTASVTEMLDVDTA